MQSRPEDFSEVTDDVHSTRERHAGHLTLKGAVVLAMLAVFCGQIERTFADSSNRDGVPADQSATSPDDAISPGNGKAIEQLAITNIESRFAALGKYVLKNLDTCVKDDSMREKIRRIFGIFYANLNNPRRNANDGRVVYFGEEKGFGIHLAPTKYYERFSGLTRRITLSRFFNPNDISQLAIFAHALTHVEQDNDYRVAVPWTSYKSFYSSRGLAAVLQDEVDAVERSIVILNVVTNGEIERAAKRGKFPHIPTVDPQIATALGRCAFVYYSNSGDLPSLVREMISQDGNSQFFSKQLQPVYAH